MSKKKTKKSRTTPMMKSGTCPVCRHKFSYEFRGGEPVKYCSVRCRRLANKRKSEGKPVDYVAPIGQTKICPVCGKKYVNKYVGQETCSVKCRLFVANARKTLKYWKVSTTGLSMSEVIAKYNDTKAERKRQKMAKIEEKFRKKEEAARLRKEARLQISIRRSLSNEEIVSKRKSYSKKREEIDAKKEAAKIAKRDQERKEKDIIADRAERLGLKTMKVKCSRCGHEYRYVVSPYDPSTRGRNTKVHYCSDYCKFKTNAVKFKMDCEKYGRKHYRYGNYRPDKDQEKVLIVTRSRGTGFYSQAKPKAVRVAKDDVDKFLTGNWNVDVEDVNFDPTANIQDLIPQNMEDFS